MNSEYASLFGDKYSLLKDVLEESKLLGFLGPGSVVDHISHALNYLPFASVSHVTSALDLGAGGGLPGLPISLITQNVNWVFLDSMGKRCQFLKRAILKMGLADVCAVEEGRAEAYGRNSHFREKFDLVISRGFGRPAVTAECGSAFLKTGGVLAVSEPPEPIDRWDKAGLATLGLQKVEDSANGGSVVGLRKYSILDVKYPRRVGVPGKRPLW